MVDMYTCTSSSWGKTKSRNRHSASKAPSESSHMRENARRLEKQRGVGIGIGMAGSTKDLSAVSNVSLHRGGVMEKRRRLGRTKRSYFSQSRCGGKLREGRGTRIPHVTGDSASCSTSWPVPEMPH